MGSSKANSLAESAASVKRCGRCGRVSKRSTKIKEGTKQTNKRVQTTG